MKRMQLHQSGLALFHHCPEAFRRRYIAGDTHPPATYMLVGSATDEAVASDFQSKIDHGVLLDEEMVAAIAEDVIEKAFQGNVSLDADERSFGKEKVKGFSKTRAVRFARWYHRLVAPTMHVVEVRRRWSIRLDKFLAQRGVKGLKIDFVGEVDQRENDGLGGIVIHDLKTTAKSKPGDQADRSIQLTSYALGEQVETGSLPSRVQLDILVDLQGGIKQQTLTAVHGDYHIAALFNRIEILARSLKAGIFPPASREHWKCSAKWCNYFGDCAYVTNRLSVSLTVPDPRLNRVTSSRRLVQITPVEAGDPEND